MRRESKLVRAIPVAGFVLLFATLAISSFTQKSASWDEPHHLATGYTALRSGDFRLDPEHPPLLRMWAAVPLLFSTGVRLDLDRDSWNAGDAYEFGHEFLYLDNDADSLLYRARCMTVVLGIVLGLVLWAWARELFGPGPALCVLVLYAFEPNVLAHARLVTTDLGVTLFMFAAVYFLWRTTRRFSWPDVLSTAASCALAVVSKYSAMILGPVFVLLLLPRLLGRGDWPGPPFVATARGRRIAVASVLGVSLLASYAAMWAVFAFRYAPTPAPPEQHRFVTSSTDWVIEQAPALATAVEWIDAHRLLPNASSQGFLFGQLRARRHSAYFAGDVYVQGWWGYFPTALLIKTPLISMALALSGLACLARRRDTRASTLPFLVLLPAALLLAAMLANLNIGIRHVLPVYPLMLLATGPIWVRLVRWRRSIASLVLALAVIESAWVHPDYLAYFNLSVGGPARGHRYLLDSNLDWGQDLKGLKRWMDEQGVDHVNLSYRGTADPAYYAISCTHLPGSPFFAEHSIAAPRLPGFVAVSATNLHGVYLDGPERQFFRPLLEREPVAVIGHSIHVYRVERPWW